MTTNEKKLRQLAADTIISWEGYTKANGKHKKIVDLYNSQSKLPSGYKVKYTDAWCATTVSAVGVQLGISEALLPECSCSRMIDLYKEAGRWEEKDSYVPDIGDLIMYDWDDSGLGDNTGAPEHVGMVIEVDKTNIYVMEGNKNNAVARRTIKINGRYIRGFCLPDYAKASKGYKFPATSKTTSTVKNTTTTSATSTTKKKIVPVTVSTTVPEVRNGVECDAVKVLQTVLTYLGFACGDIDGDFGEKTEAAVKKYQTAIGISADGICGKTTWKYLILGKKKK